MLPARQRLCSDKRARLTRKLRLKKHLDLASIERTEQIGIERAGLHSRKFARDGPSQ